MQKNIWFTWYKLILLLCAAPFSLPSFIFFAEFNLLILYAKKIYLFYSDTGFSSLTKRWQYSLFVMMILSFLSWLFAFFVTNLPYFFWGKSHYLKHLVHFMPWITLFFSFVKFLFFIRSSHRPHYFLICFILTMYCFIFIFYFIFYFHWYYLLWSFSVVNTIFLLYFQYNHFYDRLNNLVEFDLYQEVLMGINFH
tara:strand:- start:2736 stop:3320 length:585 start_codon:yes stop_codon:yes gene_type:complete